MIQQKHAMSYLFIALTIAFTVAGQLIVKWGMSSVGARPEGLDIAHYMLRVLLNPGFILGMSCAVVAAVCWALTLTVTPISFAYPFTTLGLVLVMLLSGLIFGETVPANRWIGVVVVIAGVIIAAR
jgi:multidrug transporter EmrE-like cation transporter